MTAPAVPGLYLRRLALGPMKNFVYLVGSSTGKETAIVDPAWDLAAVMIEGVTPPATVDALHRGYGLHPRPADISRLWLMRAALHLVAGSWTYAEIAGGNTAGELPALLERCLKNLERMLDDPDLPLHLARAAGTV